MIQLPETREENVRLSRFISLILRHNPGAIGISIERKGAWADVNALIDGINRSGKFRIDRPLLEKIVASDSKGRYSFSPDGQKIRANQGHSIDVVIEMEHRQPPEYLYHGTAWRFMESIMAKGLLPGNRRYVHLSPDYETAVKVGCRPSKPDQPVVLRVHAAQMAEEGFDFMISDNGVWQIATVPPQYLEIMEGDAGNGNN